MKLIKIKDDVDLRVLKKYSFEHTIGNTWFKETNNSNNRIYHTCIIVNPLDAIIKNQISHYVNNDRHVCLDEEEVDLTSDISIIYDLIKNDLVEVFDY